MHRPSCFLLAAVLFSAPGSQVTAQPSARSSMRGEVQDDKGHPLEGARVEFFGLDLATTTSGAGKYRLVDIQPGKYWVMVRRIGYQALKAALSFNPGEN